MNKCGVLQKICNKVGKEDLIEKMAELSNPEFNSLMLEVFRKRTENIKPFELLTDFEQNRFVQPSDTDMVRSMELELDCLKLAEENGFQTIRLSPVAPIGSCSIFGTVNQNKVISGLRGTEVVADCTNVLALKIAKDFRYETSKDKIVSYSTVHRLTRGQQYENPDFTPHFSAFCLTSGGFDRGHFSFEINQLNRHISVLLSLLNKYFQTARLHLRFYLKSENEQLEKLLKQDNQAWSNLKYEIVQKADNKYYETMQYTIFLSLNDKKIDIADGGFVDWTQKIIENRKHRMLSSGVGIDLIQKLYSK